jgi:hypothetical protein
MLYSFWGCFKDRDYDNNPQTEEELKEYIRREIANIPSEQFQRALPPVRRIPACRGTAFSTTSVISKL